MPEHDDTVLVAGADPSQYATWLDDDWTVQTAGGGDELHATVGVDVAVIVLDQTASGPTPETQIDTLREDGIDRPVVVLYDSEPDADAVGLRANDYLVKPVAETALEETVAELAALTDEDVQKSEYVSLAATQAALELQLSPDERESSDQYAELTDRLASLRERADTSLDDLREMA